MLETDYDNYAIVYSCHDIFGFSKIHYTWLLTRTPELREEVLSKAEETLKNKVSDYDFNNFRLTKQGADCKYL